jgi:C4-dicarboxylate-specific signal transduction histidine kinase
MSGLVLLVDDDDANLVVCEAALDTLDCVTACDAQTALEILRTREVAVLLTDQRMPGMSGVELCEAASRESPETVRILITAYSDLKAAIDAINLGQVRRYLRKPWEPEELSAEVRDALDVYNLTARLRDAEQRLYRTEQIYTMGMGAAELAHEVNNPLTLIVNNHDFLKSVLREVRSSLLGNTQDLSHLRTMMAEVDEALVDMDDGYKRIMEVVQSVRMPLQAGTNDQDVDLGEVVRLAVRLVKTQLQSRASLVVDANGGPLVRGSNTKLGQIMINLLRNAIQAFGDRPRHQNLIYVDVCIEDDMACVRVGDNGPGLDDKVAARAFEPFFTTKGATGTGLGLAICRTLVDEHGGTLSAGNRPGGGALFTLRLPRLHRE